MASRATLRRRKLRQYKRAQGQKPLAVVTAYGGLGQLAMNEIAEALRAQEAATRRYYEDQARALKIATGRSLYNPKTDTYMYPT